MPFQLSNPVSSSLSTKGNTLFICMTGTNDDISDLEGERRKTVLHKYLEDHNNFLKPGGGRKGICKVSGGLK